MSIVDQCHTHLEKGQKIGLSFTIVASFVSCFTVVGLLITLMRSVIRLPRGEWKLINTDIDAYFLSLLLADTLQAVGGLMNIKWANAGQTYCSDFCTIQGLLQQIGSPATALFTLAVALHTFFVIFYNWIPPRNHVIGLSVVCLIWIFILSLVFISWAVNVRAHNMPYFSPTPYWCWLNERFMAQRIAGEYVWIWLSALISLLAYLLLFFRLRGNIVVNPDDWTRIRVRWNRRTRPLSVYGYRGNSQRTRRSSMFRLSSFNVGFSSRDGRTGMGFFSARNETSDSPPEWGMGVISVDPLQEAVNSEQVRRAQREARKMLWYPLCYVVVILPMSAVRWKTFVGTSNSPPFALVMAFNSIFKLSGFVNVLLFSLTRPNVLSFRKSRARHSGSNALSQNSLSVLNTIPQNESPFEVESSRAGIRDGTDPDADFPDTGTIEGSSKSRQGRHRGLVDDASGPPSPQIPNSSSRMFFNSDSDGKGKTSMEMPEHDDTIGPDGKIVPLAYDDDPSPSNFGTRSTFASGSGLTDNLPLQPPPTRRSQDRRSASASLFDTFRSGTSKLEPPSGSPSNVSRPNRPGGTQPTDPLSGILLTIPSPTIRGVLGRVGLQTEEEDQTSR